MAEAFLNALCGDKYEAKSAGITPTGLNPYVVKAMSEVGIDLSTHRSKSLVEFQGKNFEKQYTKHTVIAWMWLRQALTARSR